MKIKVLEVSRGRPEALVEVQETGFKQVDGRSFWVNLIVGPNGWQVSMTDLLMSVHTAGG